MDFFPKPVQNVCVAQNFVIYCLHVRDQDM